MSNILEGLKKGQENLVGAESIMKDKEKGELFNSYALAANKQAEIAVLLETPTNELSVPDKKELNRHVVEFSKRLQAAESLISTLEQRDLSTVLEGSIPDLPKGGLALYIKGIGVRNPMAFKTLSRQITDIEKQVFGKTETGKVSTIETELKKLAAQHGISDERLALLIQEPSSIDRNDQISAAMGGEVTEKGKSVWDRVVGGLNGPRENSGKVTRNVGTEINTLIDKYRSEITIAQGKVTGFGNSFTSIDTSDEYFTKIPDILKAKREALPPEKKPLTLEQARSMIKPENMLQELEKDIEKKYGSKAVEELRGFIHGDQNLTLDDIRDLQIGGGTPDAISLGDLYDKTASRVQESVKSRGLVSALIELLFGTSLSDLGNKKDDVLNLAKSKY